MKYWPIFVPIVTALVLAASFAVQMSGVLVAIAVVALCLAVTTAVHHAEVVAHRVGEPFGTLVLALAVTVIEVALILSVMLAAGADAAELARDTIYSAVMIICTGVIGICLLVGGIQHGEQAFRIEGTGPGLAALTALATLSLVLPTFTTSSAEGTYTVSQLAFVAVASLLLWGVFVFVQTVRHRDYFLPVGDAANADVHADPPTLAATWTSFGLLLVSLIVVVGLAKVLSPTIEAQLIAIGAPKTVLGIAIAALVLLPETVAAVRAARANRLQTSMNLAVGSALASIGLTIPVVVVAVVALGLPLTLGLPAKDITLLALAFVVSSITLGTGRTYLMQGAVHLVLFAAFLVLALVP